MAGIVDELISWGQDITKTVLPSVLNSNQSSPTFLNYAQQYGVQPSGNVLLPNGQYVTPQGSIIPSPAQSVSNVSSTNTIIVVAAAVIALLIGLFAFMKIK